MKNSFGVSISVTLFGESHGEMIGAVIDGIAPGVKIDHDFIKMKLSKRRPRGRIATARVEADEYSIVSGEFLGHTTGTPLTILIPNTQKRSGDYKSLANTPRPGHADYTAECKYHGFQDPRGGGHFSGRITAALVAAGAILESALNSKGIEIGTHVKSIHGVAERGFSEIGEDIALLREREFPALDENVAEKMIKTAEAAAEVGDSVGGVLETAIIGVPAGVGEPWFDSAESMLSHALFSVPAVKGVEFGRGFEMAELFGSEANDSPAVRDGKVVTLTNNNGGINGGITNGMPIIFRCAVKPTPSIYKEQDTVDLSTMTDTKMSIAGRHDPCIVQRAAAVVDAVSAIVIADLITQRYGTDYLANSSDK